MGYYDSCYKMDNFDSCCMMGNPNLIQFHTNLHTHNCHANHDYVHDDDVGNHRDVLHYGGDVFLHDDDGVFLHDGGGVFLHDGGGVHDDDHRHVCHRRV